MKRLLLVIISALMILQLTACGGIDPESKRYAFVTNTAGISGSPEAESVWQGVQEYSNVLPCVATSYTPLENSVKEYKNQIKTAVKDGAKIVVCYGEDMSVPVFNGQKDHKKIKFVLIDAVPMSEDAYKELHKDDPVEEAPEEAEESGDEKKDDKNTDGQEKDTENADDQNKDTENADEQNKDSENADDAQNADEENTGSEDNSSEETAMAEGSDGADLKDVRIERLGVAAASEDAETIEAESADETSGEDAKAEDGNAASGDDAKAEGDDAKADDDDAKAEGEDAKAENAEGENAEASEGQDGGAADISENIRENTCVVKISYRDVGYLAGYAAVSEGYTTLGFMAGEDNEINGDYMDGFVEGADTAAKERAIAKGGVKVLYSFTGSDKLSPMTMKKAVDMYGHGAQTIFAPEYNICKAVAKGAETTQTGNVLTVGTTEGDLSSDRIILNIQLNYGRAAYSVLEDFENEEFEGGKIVNYGLREECVTIPQDLSKFNSFTANTFEILKNNLKSNQIVMTERNMRNGGDVVAVEAY